MPPDPPQRHAPPPRGLIDDLGALGPDVIQHTRWLPPDPDALVVHVWIVRWALPRGREHVQRVASHPNLHLTFEGEGAWVHGVVTRRFERRLAGEGVVVGVKLRPGASVALFGRAAATLTDQRVALDALLPVAPPLPVLSSPREDEALAAQAARFVAALDRAPLDAHAIRAQRAVALAEADREITRVDALAEAIGVSARTLQRVFYEHVGVSPKRVIRRFRLHEALDVLARGEDEALATLAARLGYTDQAHLTRDFAELVGVPPGVARTTR